jgi:hypothetical protein
LPPAWTATPTSTSRPPVSTATPVPSSSGRTSIESLTRTPAPPLIHATAAAAEFNLAGWQKIDTGHAYFWLPDSYEVADMSGLGDMMEILMVALVEGLSQGFQEMASEGTPGPTPTPLSLDEMRAGFDIDLLMAADKGLGSAVFVVSEPEGETTDLAVQLEDAVTDVKGLEQVLSRVVIDGAPFSDGSRWSPLVMQRSGALSHQAIFVIRPRAGSAPSPARPDRRGSTVCCRYSRRSALSARTASFKQLGTPRRASRRRQAAYH